MGLQIHKSRGASRRKGRIERKGQVPTVPIHQSLPRSNHINIKYMIQIRFLSQERPTHFDPKITRLS